LGFWERGGGACGEHSHAINLWQHFALRLGFGRVVEVSSVMDMVQKQDVYYDRISNISLRTEKGHYGYVVQDVVTDPTKKYLRAQGDQGFIELHMNWDARGDAIIYGEKEKEVKQISIEKTRLDDFRLEVEHLDQIMSGGETDSPISLQRGLDTMLAIAAAYRSHLEKRPMYIDYSKGNTPESISPL
jgi:predicted dehydrogenase